MLCCLSLQKNLKNSLILKMNKLNSAYKSIGEVAEILDLRDEKKGRLCTHTIRFWEQKFKQIKPKLFNSNRRYYDQKSILILKKFYSKYAIFLLTQKILTVVLGISFYLFESHY